MTQFRDFEDIDVWKESRKLTRAIREICKREKAARDWAFIDQITRSVRSIGANIAEGNDAMTVPEFISYLGHAKRSAAEVRSHLFDGFDEDYLSREEFYTLTDHAKKIGSMLAKLIHHLQSLDSTKKRTWKVVGSPHRTNEETNKRVNQ